MDSGGGAFSPAQVSFMTPHPRNIKVPAGRMVLQDGIVRPLLGRGLLCLLRDTLMDELILTWVSVDGNEEQRFPLPRGRVRLSWVEKCTSGRVMLFDVDDGRQLFFFWMQSRSTELADKTMRRLQHVLERHRHHLLIAPKSDTIKMSTFRRVLGEVWEEAVAQDVDLDALLSSPKLIEALQEDPEFYRSRLMKHLSPSIATAADTPLDLVSLVQDSQVQWASVILSTMLRRKDTSNYLFTLFLDAASPWSLSVVAFIMQIIQMYPGR
ncbi:hypothetical protein TraAM80_09002 [Trypanosoma rangeli]|uniref:Pru domain-containing protein n=1 Tax=Trypanosoma rangeli TaxID=5698 RepID=A0A3R7K022_TRYRA|nr:uncharacterized protein TraAM80_09002 [Trypanosoma rangeli]RNE98221.1 hypothetical protein TraAM80_09002 [Trypanosoma rangeli]|eukprot:RNE98221.1 hypothetical protein TraAM80_09002 [Trypanosoma rangeli]